MIRIIDDFSGASIGRNRVEGSRIYASLRCEKNTSADGREHDYNVHFYFGIENLSTKRICAEVFINTTTYEDLPEVKPFLFVQNSQKDPCRQLCAVSRFDQENKKLYFSFEIDAHETLYVSNTVNRLYPDLDDHFRQLAEKGGAVQKKIGSSSNKNPLWAYEYFFKPSNKPIILISSGFHPREPDAWASEAIMEYLSRDEGRRVFDNYSVILLPVVNPDGFVLGYNGCNAAQNNFYWNFLTDDREDNPESFYIWKYVTSISPCIYIDFHCYTYDVEGKYPGPYLKPRCFYDGKYVRAVVKDMEKSLLSFPGTKPFKGYVTIAPSMLCSRLTKKFNTITFAKYHLHLAEGEETSKERAVSLFKEIIKNLEEHKIITQQQILLKPSGAIKRGVFLVYTRILIYLYFRYVTMVRARIRGLIKNVF